MAQIFHPSTNTISRVSIFGAIFILAGLLWTLAEVMRSSYVTQVDVARDQPVPFSHQHHVSGLGIDCRYCHTSVETSSFAGIPATQDVHDLPLADLGDQPDPGAGPPELPHRAVDLNGRA